MPKSKIKPNKPTARVLIVDDHPAVREALTIRIGGSGEADGLVGVGRLAANLQVRLCLNAYGQRLTHGRVIIDDQDPGHRLL